MISAPWAMFTMFMTPQMSDMPSAMMPYSPPSRMPLITTWTRSTGLLPLGPLRRRIQRLPGERPTRVDGHDGAVLDLDHHLRKRDLPRRFELHAPVERLRVQG